MSKQYRPYEPDQRLLLPPNLDEWLPEDHMARFVRDVVGELGLWRRPHHSRVNSPTAPDMHRQASGDEHSDCFLLKYGNEIK